MRFTKILVVIAMCAPMAAFAQSHKTKKAAPADAAAADAPAAAPAPASAKKKSIASQVKAVGGNGYGLAGCGLGSVVFGPAPGMIQIVAATLNGTGVQTFGITTGTSNCDIPEAGHQAAVFIEVNREVVANDAARGQGETMNSLAAILNCSDAAAFSQGLQQNFETIFSKQNDSFGVTRAILSTIEANPTLKSTCRIDG